MNAQEINRLLEKYYRGESSEAEESTLRSFFLSDNIPDEMEFEKDLFSYYSEAEEIYEPSCDFENKIIAALDNRENKAGINIIRRGLLTIMSAAAGLLLILGLYIFFNMKSEPRDTFSSPEIAYTETIKILHEVSLQLNRGTQALEPVIKFEDAASKSFATLNKSTGLIGNNLRNLDYFQTALIMTYSPMEININK
jgi:hypothetical protein